MSKKAGRRIFVGDVQGCADELEDLLEAVDFRKKKDALWFVGDIVNRGPKSLRALELAVDLGANSVLGNHDVHLLMVAAGARRLGRRDTLKPILKSSRSDELLAWLRRRPLVKVWDDLLVVHAALHPRWRDVKAIAKPLEKAIRKGKVDWNDPALLFFTSVRYCDKRGRLPPRGRRRDRRYHPWDVYYKGDRTVVFGHWAARGLVKGRRVRGLDTGCVWGGRLTAWIAEQDKIVSVPARKAYDRIR